MHQFLQPLAGVIGIFAYVLLIAGLLKTKVEQSFVAFLLWATLDSIATITTILKEGNYWLPLSNSVGSTIVTILLVVKKQISWSWLETVSVALVIICLITWYVAGDRAGIISSSLAVVIASIPQMADTYKKPATTPTRIYLVFLIANILSFIAGRSWTIEERFYPGCAVFLVLVIVLFSMKKFINTRGNSVSGA